MPENNDQQKTLNEVENLSEMNSTAPIQPKYTNIDGTGAFYKAVIKQLNTYSKGELLLRDELIKEIRNIYENL